MHARPVTVRRRLRAVQLVAAQAAGTGLRWLGGAGESLTAVGLLAGGAGWTFGVGWGLMTAGAVLLGDVVWERLS